MKLQVEHKLKVGNYMSSPVATVDPEMNFEDAVQIMLIRGIGNLAVVDGEKVEGVITERELLQYLALNKTIPNKLVKFVLSQKFAKVTPETSIPEAARIMISKKARLLVFQKDARTGADLLVGIITASDIVKAFLETGKNPPIEAAMANIVYTIRPDGTILSAVKMMLKKGIGSVVVSPNGKPTAIFTERDLLNRVLGVHADIEDKVGSYCTFPIKTARLGIGARDAAKILLANKIKRLPLTKDGKIVAMVTTRDLVEAFQRS